MRLILDLTQEQYKAISTFIDCRGADKTPEWIKSVFKENTEEQK